MKITKEDELVDFIAKQNIGGIAALYDAMIEKNISSLSRSPMNASVRFFLETGVCNGGFRDAMHKLLNDMLRLAKLAYKGEWVRCEDTKPEHNISVLVFIPEEDDHITTGMWDISCKWVLLDEYREVEEDKITHWMKCPEKPE